MTHTDPLPPLPDPWTTVDGEWCGQNTTYEVYTAAQMRDYARAALPYIQPLEPTEIRKLVETVTGERTVSIPHRWVEYTRAIERHYGIIRD